MREKERSTRIIYVRHGETDFPLNRIYCDDREDPALNRRGQEQALYAAEALSNVEIDALYSSPCLRTQMTSESIAVRHPGLNIQLDSRLQERHFGGWEGLYFDEIERDYPEGYRAWKSDQAAYKPEGGESVYEMLERVKPAVDEAIERHRGKTVVIVAHVGPIRVLLAEAIGIQVGAYRQLQIDPASISRVDYGKTQNNLILLNFHARHWGEGEQAPQ